MPSGSNDPVLFQEFRDALGMHDPKTIATYLTTMRHFVAWLATQSGGTPFHMELVTETAIRGYIGLDPFLGDERREMWYKKNKGILHANLMVRENRSYR